MLSLAAGPLLPAVENDAADHGQDEGFGLLRFVAVLSLLIAGALPLCGVFAGERSNGVRATAIVLDALSLLNGALSLLQGGGISVVPGIAPGRQAATTTRGGRPRNARSGFSSSSTHPGRTTRATD
ncbi:MULTISPECIES: hypothetical protein [unclassified Streptomyces]|uniref:hypothetical protein n=1 Tax=unclassified Streptomyces TaxID=2593676 RepID=UPI002E18F98F